MKIITVCGSLKFYKEIVEMALKMELEGNCMLVPIYNPYNTDKDAFTDEEIKRISKMHYEKIKLSDAILVVDVDGYIGSSTSNEIESAKTLNKEILYYSDLTK